MAGKKGKAQRRKKDWSRQYRTGLGPEGHERESLLEREVKLPAYRLEAPAPMEVSLERQEVGMVVGLIPGGAVVRSADKDLLCGMAGTFRPPAGSSALAVGDEVMVALSPPAGVSGDPGVDRQRVDGLILSRQLRRTVLSRPQPISAKRRQSWDEPLFEKVLAANMEVALVVASVRQPVVRPALIDRFCIVAQRGDMTPVVVFNKTDLGEPDAEVVAELQEGRIVFVRCSAQTGVGLGELAAVLAGKRSVLVGPSGAGKSSLVNALVPGCDLATREIRFKDQRGRHVTATASIHQLPGGGQIVDTPGVRELAMGMTPDQAPWYFPEIEALLGQCKFNDCTHTHEPHCAVIAAAESGAISTRRYQSYLRILESI